MYMYVALHISMKFLLQTAERHYLTLEEYSEFSLTHHLPVNKFIIYKQKHYPVFLYFLYMLKASATCMHI